MRWAELDRRPRALTSMRRVGMQYAEVSAERLDESADASVLLPGIDALVDELRRPVAEVNPGVPIRLDEVLERRDPPQGCSVGRALHGELDGGQLRRVDLRGSLARGGVDHGQDVGDDGGQMRCQLRLTASYTGGFGEGV